MDELQKIRYVFNAELVETNTIEDLRSLVIKYLGENDGIVVKFALQFENPNQDFINELEEFTDHIVNKIAKKCKRIKEKNNETI